MIYFDNAATSNYKPLQVKWALYKALKRSANPGRSGHKLSLLNAKYVWETRDTIAKEFGGIKPENVIFTKNCTESLNIILQGLCKNKKGNIILSCFEHNSIIRPLHELAKLNNITLTIISPENKKYITKLDVEKAIKEDTFLVCVNSYSNVTGNKNDFENIAKLCKKKGILYLLDNAQGVGHSKIDMKALGIDFLTFSGHKGFLSPQGIGVLCINSKEKITPLIYGGTGSESDNYYQPIFLPEALESGTLATPLIFSLNSGINYVNKHFEKHNKKVISLTKYLTNQLKKYKEISIYSSENYESGIVPFNIKGFDSIEIADYLDENFKIACRGGLHCAPLAHKFLGTLQSGIVRISLSFKNSYKEINRLLKVLKLLINS